MQTMLLPKSVCNELEQMHRNFVSNSSEARRWHSVAWEKIRRPKMKGGLGFKSPFHFNQTLMMKIGWGLIHTPDAYWARIIKSKYHCGDEIIPRVTTRNSESLVQCLREECLVNFVDTWSTFRYLDQLLPADLVPEIAAHPCPAPELGKDSVIWGGNSNGLFSTKSAYNLIEDCSSSNSDPLWRAVWHWMGINVQNASFG
ncbi:hypothetical protein SESBI_33650 [Sesbania bispinosa]|nr:hypothetical protein SESBI_33650 [Sesbania bispinosa]